MQRHKYTYWTTEELQTLRILRFVEGLPYNEIGIALNRNWQSCCNAVHKYFKKELGNPVAMQFISISKKNLKIIKTRKNVKKNLFMNWQKKELKERLLLKDWE